MPSYSKLPSNDQLTDLVWIQTGFIGDIILTTGAIERARQYFPHVRQHLITTKTGKMVLEKGLPLESLHVFDKASGVRAIWQTAQAVKSKLGSGAITLQPHLSTRSSLLAQSIGNPVITFREASLAWLAKKRVPRIAVFHECDRNAVLLEALGLPRSTLVGAKPKLATRPLPATGPLAELNHSEGGSPVTWIGIAPGSIWGTKRWPSEKFSALVQRLLTHQHFGVVLIGGKDEEALCQEICNHIVQTRPDSAGALINLAGKTSLDDLRSLFPALRLVVSNDSSPVHYASVYDIPTIVIFGPTIPAFGFGPLAAKTQIIETLGLECRPCGNHGPQSCPLGHFKCMKLIDVDQVYNACIAMVS